MGKAPGKGKEGQEGGGKKEQAGPFHNPFAKLAEMREALPPATPQVRPEDFPEEPPAKGPARAVVRLERAGRGGKEVTVVEHLELPEAELQTWLKALQRGLGCGGTVEGERLVLQGDHRFKLPDLLLRRGVRRVVQG